MAANDEWCQEKLTKLLNEDTRVPILKEVKDFLSSIPRDEMARTAKSLELPLIFDCLNDSNSEQIDLACEVLALCMTNLHLGESTNKYGVFLERALNHPHSGAKLMALNEIKRNIDNDDILIDLCKRQSLLINIVKCISDADIAVAKRAAQIITTIGLSTFGIQQITNADILKTLNEIMAISEIVRTRVYDVFVDIGKQSEANFALLQKQGLLDRMLVELDTTDVLVKLSILELLSQLASCKQGYDWLEMNQILKKLASFLESDDLISVPLCEPGVLKFFANMARWNPIEVVTKYPNMVERLLNNAQSNDFTIAGVALDSLGYMGLPNDGKIALDCALMETTVRNLAKTLPSLPTEIKVRALNCLENLLRVNESNVQVSLITRKWFQNIDDHPMDFIGKYAKNPFSELRLAGFGVLHAIGGQVWGAEAIRDTPGLVEFLLDRTVETVKECKEAKYSIVELLSESSVFDHVTSKKIETFIKEGPFYVKTITEVATEGND